MQHPAVHPGLAAAPLPAELPAELLVEETVDGVRYQLPARTLGGGHIFGAAVAVAGIMLVAGGAWWAIAIVGNGPGGGGMMLAAVLLPALALILIGGVLWATGLFITNGRTDIELRGTRLRRIERAGPLRWTRSHPIDGLTRLRIARGLAQDPSINEAITAGRTSRASLVPSAAASGVPGIPGAGAAGELGWLGAEYESGRSAKLLMAYPQPWLHAIAHDLSRRLAVHPARRPGAKERVEVVMEEPAGRRSRRADEPHEQPADSAIEVSRIASGSGTDGLTITIPPLGLRERKGAFSIGAMWNGAMAVFTGGMFGFLSAPWYVNVSIGAFWGLSVLFMLVAVSVGRRSAIIDVVDDTVLITRRSLVGVSQKQWRRDELRTIECAPSGLEVNEQPVMQLQITPAAGGTAAFFTGRDEQELRWLARMLREALELPEEEEEEEEGDEGEGEVPGAER